MVGQWLVTEPASKNARTRTESSLLIRQLTGKKQAFGFIFAHFLDSYLYSFSSEKSLLIFSKFPIRDNREKTGKISAAVGNNLPVTFFILFLRLCS